MESEMGEAAENQNLQRLINAARAVTDGGLKKGVNAELYKEIGDLAKYLNEMFQTLQSAESDMQEASAQIPFGREQLSDVTQFTEEATHRILAYAEKAIDNQNLLVSSVEFLKTMAASGSMDLVKTREHLDRISSLSGDNKKILVDIVFALGFQDLAAQRLRKIETALQEVQSRILKLIIIFGIKVGGNTVTVDKQEAMLTELSESSKTERLEQGLVDDILKEFGF